MVRMLNSLPSEASLCESLVAYSYEMDFICDTELNVFGDLTVFCALF